MQKCILLAVCKIWLKNSFLLRTSNTILLPAESNVTSHLGKLPRNPAGINKDTCLCVRIHEEVLSSLKPFAWLSDSVIITQWNNSSTTHSISCSSSRSTTTILQCKSEQKPHHQLKWTTILIGVNQPVKCETPCFDNTLECWSRYNCEYYQKWILYLTSQVLTHVNNGID